MMDDKEFFNWFLERVDTFAEMGIMHPNSEWGKIVKICVIATDQRFAELTSEIESLKKKVATLERPQPKKQAASEPKTTKRGWSI